MTTNGKYLLDFKIGPFASCLPVQPFTLKYDGCWGINGAMITLDPATSCFFMAAVPPFGVVRHRVYPVFTPNESMYKHHARPGED